MANGLGHLWRRLCRLSGAPAVREQSDGELLRRYVEGHDEAAFEALVRRHAGMVFGVCRRVLRAAGAAEDAFQATFLLLLRKGHSIRRLNALGCWLHGVAYRMAVRAAVNERKRRQREREAAAMRPAPPASEADAWEVRSVLDAELNRLPEKYRAPLVLCYLDGKTNDEAAQQLGWPPGTVKGRLARARELLRKRLGKRGLAVSGAALAALLAEEAAAAAPLGWVTATLRAAALWATGQTAAGAFSANAVALTEGVMRSMFLKKVITAGALLLAAVLGVGVSAGAYRAWGHRAPEAADPAPKTPPNEPTAAPVPREPGRGAPEDPTLPKGAVARLGKPVKQTAFPTATVAYSRDGKRIAWVTTAAGNPKSTVTVHVWDTATRKEVSRCEFAEDTAEATSSVALGPDGKTVAIATRHEVVLGAGKSERYGVAQVRLFDADKGKEFPRFEGHRAAVGSEIRTLAFTPDGKTITTNHDMEVQVWDVESGKVVRRVAFASEDDGGGIAYEIVSPGGGVFASGLNNDPVRLWDVGTGKKIREIADAGAPHALSLDGKILAAQENRGILFWSVETGKKLGEVPGRIGPRGTATFSADGKLLAWVDAEDTVHFAAVATGQEVGGFKSEGGQVAFSPDGKTLASLCRDGTVLLWKVPADGN
jgi:RNA polymerase sigma factor (sigma-70 family)